MKRYAFTFSTQSRNQRAPGHLHSPYLAFQLTLLAGLMAFLPALAQIPSDWKAAGQLKTRSAKEIKASTWSIGGETLDRDYTDYHSYKKYLGPLGAKRIRLQGGWAKCEKVPAEGRPGQYDFAWLDAVVDDALSQGVQPWIQLSYGNPIYKGGGDAQLAGGIPASPEALAAWDAWVRAIVTHFKSRVQEWEIWNEPDLSGKISPADFASFYIRTTEGVRQVQPEARLLAMALCVVSRLDFVEPLFQRLQQENKQHLVDVLTYHGYSHNPDNSYPDIEKLRAMVWKYNPKVIFMQGENGAPSTPKAITIGAMRDQDWTELSQAKWDLRRMLGDHGRGIATNLFTISDIHYASGDHMTGINSKGLLKTRADKSIEGPKLSYQAAQHVFSLFDDQLELLPTTRPATSQETTSAFQYRQRGNGGTLVTLWSSEARPVETYEPKRTEVKVEGSFKNPVYVDLITGKAYDIPKKQWKKSGKQFTFTDIPVPDYPVLIAEKSSLPLEGGKQ